MTEYVFPADSISAVVFFLRKSDYFPIWLSWYSIRTTEKVEKWICRYSRVFFYRRLYPPLLITIFWRDIYLWDKINSLFIYSSNRRVVWYQNNLIGHTSRNLDDLTRLKTRAKKKLSSFEKNNIIIIMFTFPHKSASIL